MELKLGEVLNIYYALKEVIDKQNNVDAILKFKLLGFMKLLEPYYVNYNVVRDDKIREFGTTSENGASLIKADDTEAIEKFNNEMTALINSDIVLNIQKLKAEDIFDRGIDSECLIKLYSIIEE